MFTSVVNKAVLAYNALNNNSISWLSATKAKLACIPVNPEQIEILKEPTDFFNKLKVSQLEIASF